MFIFLRMKLLRRSYTDQGRVGAGGFGMADKVRQGREPLPFYAHPPAFVMCRPAQGKIPAKADRKD
jgi:hypothetical protein